MKNELELAFNEIAEVRSLDPTVVLEALRTALISAYRREANASAAQSVDAYIDPATGRTRIFVEKEVVEEVFESKTEVELETARYYDPETNYGDMVMVETEPPRNFGRIAAQTAKQVILQKIREAERTALFEEFISKEGDIVSGTIQNVNANMATLTLQSGRAEAMLPRAQQIPGERFKSGDKVRVYVLEVKKTNRGPQIVVSRSHRNMLKRLLEFEVPEIFNGQVEIKNIAREAGGRSKVAVAALQEGIDPVGACVGMRGIRIQNIVKELHDEKIDVIEWVPNQQEFIAKALSPARVKGVYLEDDPDNGRTAVVIVPDDQLSLAIGREGQNARLAAKLTGWRIDIKSVTEAVVTALDNLDTPPLNALQTRYADMIAEVQRIMEKKNAGLVVLAEEYNTLGNFADLVERRYLEVREQARQSRLAEINAVKETLPQHAFAIGVHQLDLPESIMEALEPLENVGEIMLRFLIDENRLRRLVGNQPGALEKIQEALDKVVYPENEDEFFATAIDEEQEPEVVDEVEPVEADEEAEPVAEVETVQAAEPEEIDEDVEDDEEPDELVLAGAFDVDETAVAAPVKKAKEPAKEKEAEEGVPALPGEIDEEFEREKAERKRKLAAKTREVAEDEDFVEEEGEFEPKDKKRKKTKERQQRRQFVFDESLGEVVVKRRRKGGRKHEDWDDFK